MTSSVLLSIRRELHCLEAELYAMQRVNLGAKYENVKSITSSGDINFKPYLTNIENILKAGADCSLVVNIVSKPILAGFPYNLANARGGMKDILKLQFIDHYTFSKFLDRRDDSKIPENEIRCKVKENGGPESNILITATSDAEFSSVTFQFEFK